MPTPKRNFLYGTGKEKVDLSYIDERGRKHNRVQPFEGNFATFRTSLS